MYGNFRRNYNQYQGRKSVWTIQVTRKQPEQITTHNNNLEKCLDEYDSFLSRNKDLNWVLKNLLHKENKLHDDINRLEEAKIKKRFWAKAEKKEIDDLIKEYDNNKEKIWARKWIIQRKINNIDYKIKELEAEWEILLKDKYSSGEKTNDSQKVLPEDNNTSLNSTTICQINNSQLPISSSTINKTTQLS